jgi:hypothetical protein
MVVPDMQLAKGVAMDCWHDEIDKAASEAELMKGASDFLRLWTPRDMAPVSLGLRAMRIECSDDIERVKSRLSGMLVQSATKSHAHVRELAGYFFHAATRLAEIRRSHAAPTSPIAYLRESSGARPSAQS